MINKSFIKSIKSCKKNVNKEPDTDFLLTILKKSSQLESIYKELTKKKIVGYPNMNFKLFIELLNSIIPIINERMEYLNNKKKVFYDDFNNSIFKLDSFIDIFIKLFLIMNSQMCSIEFINKVKNEIDNFCHFSNVFISNIKEILLEIREPNKNENIIDTRLGIESVMFNFSNSIEFNEEYQFVSSKSAQIYTYYNKIININDNLVYLQSYYGTGKSLYLPIILLSRCLKEEMKIPFLLMTCPTENYTYSIFEYFNLILSKYVTIIKDTDKLIEIYNKYEESGKIDKIVLGILTPNDLLYLMYNLSKNRHFYPNTRFLVDDVQKRTIYTDILISKISESKCLFTLPMNVILSTQLIEPSITNIFNGKLKTIDLNVKNRYRVTSKKPIYENNIEKINSTIVPNETIKVVNEMSKKKSNINDGHILCFTSNKYACKKIKDSISSFINSNKNQNESKVVILQTSLLENEKIDNYFNRLHEEYTNKEKEIDDPDDALFFVFIIVHDKSNKNIFELIENEFPKSLIKIKKIILMSSTVEYSFNIENLSVVVDSGLIIEEEFDRDFGYSIYKETFASNDILLSRKGQLGRMKDGLYIPIRCSKTSKFETPPIQRLDLTSEIFVMKTMKINFENMKNLPNKPNFKNLCYAMDNLMYMNAIDHKTLNISKFGIEMSKFNFLSIYDAAAIVEFKYLFNNSSMAIFISSYIALIIKMGYNLIREFNNEILNKYFRENSDIVTLVNPLNSLLKSEITDHDEFKKLIKSYGFSYSTFNLFKSYLLKIINLTFPNMKISEILNEANSFIKESKGFTSLINKYIQKLIEVNPKWENYHLFQFKYINNINEHENSPNLIFQRVNDNSEITISKRPGSTGIEIPIKFYYLNNMIHTINYDYRSIQSIECNEYILIPWFDVLLESYMSNFDDYFKISYLTESQKIKAKYAYYTKLENKIYITFIQRTLFKRQELMEYIKDCLKLIPFTPRSALIYRRDVDCLVEIKSMGTEQYESTILNNCKGSILKPNDIKYCLKHIKEFSKKNSKLRICLLFAHKTCNLGDIDNKYLYFINELNENYKEDLLTTVKHRIRQLNRKQNKINHIRDFTSFFNNNNNDNEMNKIIGCIDVCNDSPLTKYPIFVYYENKSIYTNKMCRECIISSLQYAINSYVTNGIINEDALDNIFIKPSSLPTIKSEISQDGEFIWPQIPIGQLINVLINNDNELSSLISNWLVCISEYSVRTQGKKYFTFCPDHPHVIYSKNQSNHIECANNECGNVFCKYCDTWHNSLNICETLQQKRPQNLCCPKCKILTIKDGGCNHMACVCGTHWCYKCGKGFSTSNECYNHLSQVHGGCFD